LSRNQRLAAILYGRMPHFCDLADNLSSEQDMFGLRGSADTSALP